MNRSFPPQICHASSSDAPSGRKKAGVVSHPRATTPFPPVATLLCASLLLSAMATRAYSAGLRLMPIGDSITAGYRSTSDNGYRGPLYTQLKNEGNAVDFVGSQRGGNAFDPDHEGYFGNRIDQVAGLLNPDLATYQPNLVTLHLGTNDLGQGYQVATAPDRLASLIDQIIAARPGVTVLVAQLIPNSTASVQSLINTYNSRIPGIVQTRVNAGKHVYTVSMSALTLADLNDGLHPNDGGYQKMANAWDAAVQQVAARGWISNIDFAGAFELQNVYSGLAVDVNGASTANSAAVIQYPYGGGRNQLWNFIPTSNGYYQIKNANSALDLNVAGVRTDNSAPIVQYQFGTQQNDQWLPVRQADGSYVFYNRRSGLVLDNPAGTAPQKQLDQWGANGGSNQRFNVIGR